MKTYSIDIRDVTGNGVLGPAAWSEFYKVTEPEDKGYGKNMQDPPAQFE